MLSHADLECNSLATSTAKLTNMCRNTITIHAVKASSHIRAHVHLLFPRLYRFYYIITSFIKIHVLASVWKIIDPTISITITNW